MSNPQPDPPPFSPPPPRPSGGAFRGLLATLGPCIMLVGIAFAMMDTYQTAAIALVMGAGVVQLAWVVPMFRNAKRTGNERMKIGLVIGASIAFLFSASCGGLLAALSTSNFH